MTFSRIALAAALAACSFGGTATAATFKWASASDIPTCEFN